RIHRPTGTLPLQLKAFSVRACPWRTRGRTTRAAARRERFISVDHPDFQVAAHRVEIQAAAAVADACVDSAPAHTVAVEHHLEVAIDLPAHGGHREIGVELLRHLERDVAAHGVELEIAAAGELIDTHDDVAAHRIRLNRACAQVRESNIAAHAVRPH